MIKLFYHRDRALFMALLVIATVSASAAEGGELDNIPAKGMPTLVVLGTPTCPPCVRMKPILEKIARQYAEKAAVIPIDVAIHTEQMARFNVKVIPVEIFFNAAGREVYRHLGFMDEKSILDHFNKMGVE